MSQLPKSRGVAIAIGVVAVIYAVLSIVVGKGSTLALVGNSIQTVLLLIAVLAIARNARRTHGHQRAFWVLMSVGCGLWFVGQAAFTYYEGTTGIHPSPGFFIDVLIFLHIVPMLAATSLQPHTDPSAEERMGLGYVDFVLLTVWWVFLYAYFVGPWQFVSPDPKILIAHSNSLYAIENLTLIAAFAILWLRTNRDWRRIYRHFYLAALLYAVSSLIVNAANAKGSYFTGSLYDLPLLISMGWFAYAGVLASELHAESEPALMNIRQQTYWHSRLAAMAAASMPFFGLYVLLKGGVHDPKVDEFRLIITLLSMVAILTLLFFKQRILDAKLVGLLHESREAFENLQKLKDHVVQTEKLASIGRLVAGAAHEINNPLTAILGYSDLMASDDRIDEANRGLADKIRQQARRTKNLVSNLLAFAKQAPMQFHRVDLNSVVQNALQLRELDLASKKITTMADFATPLPHVMGDENHLLRVCYQILNNAVDAMAESGGGTLTVRTFAENGNVVFSCADTGAGIAEPDRVFDPFYTTKEIGKGTGLGLSACYGIVRDHGGDIKAENLSTGGALFTVSLPTVETKQQRELAPAGSARN